jgi:hypothetical protein
MSGSVGSAVGEGSNVSMRPSITKPDGVTTRSPLPRPR